MGFHTFDPATADKLEDVSRYRYLSREELLAGLGFGTDSGSGNLGSAGNGNLGSPGSGKLGSPGNGDLGTVGDLGSGTGFFTDDVAPFADEIRAVDLQAEMHELYREKGVPENVDLVTADVGDLPFDDGELDAAFSTMTFHEFAGDGALAEVARVLGADGRPVGGGRLVVADWTANGDGESGPPVAERYDRDEAVALLEDAGFEILRADERPETFLVVAEAGR